MKNKYIAILDYQAGNIRSVQKALETCGVRAVVTHSVDQIRHASALVFPGQGANDSSMKNLRKYGLVNPILDFISVGKPFLGICLGLQLLLEGSDEGVEPGLGVLPGRVHRLPGERKIPHIGWNQINIHRSHPILDGIEPGTHFYFVHSYFAEPEDPSVIVGTTNYGVEFCSIAAWKNVVAVQFHPEKSGKMGLNLYRNFINNMNTTT